MDAPSLAVTAVHNIFDNQNRYGHPYAPLGHHGAAAKLGRIVAIGISCSSGRGEVGWDWSDPGWEIWRKIGTLPAGRRECRGHAIGGPDWVTFYPFGDPRYARVFPPNREARRGV